MDCTYTFKVLDRETAESFEKLINLLLGKINATVKVDIPEEERMTSLVFVTIHNENVQKYEFVMIVAEIMHAKLLKVESNENPG